MQEMLCLMLRNVPGGGPQNLHLPCVPPVIWTLMSSSLFCIAETVFLRVDIDKKNSLFSQTIRPIWIFFVICALAISESTSTNRKLKILYQAQMEALI